MIIDASFKENMQVGKSSVSVHYLFFDDYCFYNVQNEQPVTIELV